MTSTKNLPIISLAILILALPAFAYIEHKYNDVFNSRLAIPNINPDPNLHTPIHTDGTYLPPTINKDVTYTTAQSPLLLNNTLTITPQGSLTIQPGVTIYVAEYGQILNQGTINFSGTITQPITLSTNEANQANQNWSGIINDNHSEATLNNIIIQNASPAISCLTGSTVTITNTQIEHGNLGIYNQSQNCTITNTTITGVRDGIINIGPKAITSNVTIQATHTQIQNVNP